MDFNGCQYCDEISPACQIFPREDGRTFYIELRTNEWDEYDDNWVYLKKDISYCPYCGKKLEVSNEANNNN